ncbi:aminotransferase class IV [Streptomyces sp. NPDC051909]|uniref:aminotransferase class IV n=1 Tax=Streptomyces sp. NPDC051909 TaxID=3154944 RepID=UPI00342917C2
MATVDGVPASTAQLAALALTNYGHFTTLRIEEGGGVRGLPLHLDRLVRDCAAVFGAALDPERVVTYVREAADGRSGALNVRVTVFDPALDITRPAEPAGDPRVLVTVRPAGGLFPPPLRVTCRPYRRDVPAVKHVGLFGPLALRREARSAGFDDVLFTEPGPGPGLRPGLGPAGDEQVTEGCTWNVGFVDAEGRVVWPAADVLPGVTMRLLREARPGALVRPVGTAELPALRAAFATNAAIGVRAVRAVDGHRFPADDPVLAELRAAYAALPVERLAD